MSHVSFLLDTPRRLSSTPSAAGSRVCTLNRSLECTRSSDICIMSTSESSPKFRWLILAGRSFSSTSCFTSGLRRARPPLCMATGCYGRTMLLKWLCLQKYGWLAGGFPFRPMGKAHYFSQSQAVKSD